METRVANWTLVLNGKIEEWRNRPFAWGSADCCQFAADIVSSITGTDKRGLFPTYTSRREALEILAIHGGQIGLITFALGEPKPVSWAQRGDVIATDFGDGIAAGICLGLHCCAPGEKGLVFRLTAEAQSAWSV